MTQEDVEVEKKIKADQSFRQRCVEDSCLSDKMVKIEDYIFFFKEICIHVVIIF